MKSIWKFEVTKDCFAVLMPKDAELLSAQVQTNQSHAGVVLWACVDPTADPETRVVSLLPTGIPFEADFGEFVDTVQCGEIVYHVFVK